MISVSAPTLALMVALAGVGLAALLFWLWVSMNPTGAFDAVMAIEEKRIELLEERADRLQGELEAAKAASVTDMEAALERIAGRGCMRLNDTAGHSDVYDAHAANVKDACDALAKRRGDAV